MIVLKGVAKYYNSIKALENINLEILPGYITVLLGPNGSGKTTLLKIIMGIVKPDKGSVRIFGMDPYRDGLKIRRMIGYVPEEDLIYRSLRAREYLEFVGRIYGIDRSDLDREIRRVVRAFRLEDKLDEFIGGLSHGLKRRVLLAAAFIHKPKILLLDEPFMGIDPIIVSALKEFLREEVHDGKVVIVTTHVLEIAEAIADRIILLYEGRVLADGTLHDVLKRTETGGLEAAVFKLLKADAEIIELINALRI